MHKSLLCPYPGLIFSMFPELVVVFHRMLCDFKVVDSVNVSLTNEHVRICIFTQSELFISYQFTTRYYRVIPSSLSFSLSQCFRFFVFGDLFCHSYSQRKLHNLLGFAVMLWISRAELMVQWIPIVSRNILWKLVAHLCTRP